MIIEALKRGETPDFDTIVEEWGKWFDLMPFMAKTEQDKEWHAEGDVHVHTGMVLQEIYKLLEGEASHITGDRRLALILGCIFHDIAKTICTRTAEFEDGVFHIVAPRHPEKGRSYLALKLWHLDISYQVISDVLALVGHHHDPLRLVRKDEGAHRYRRLARLADLELLYYLERADLQGRICDDTVKDLDQLELFRMFAHEYGFWQNREPYAEWQASIEASQYVPEELVPVVLASGMLDAESQRIYTPEEAVARSYGYQEGYADLVLTCGISGAGKSTWIEKNLPEHRVISMDRIRKEVTGSVEDQSENPKVLRMAVEELKDGLRKKEKIVWDATNYRRDYRQKVLDWGFNYRAFTTIVVFHIPEDEIIARNGQRERVVPEAAIRQQIRGLEWPFAYEAHQMIFVGKDGEILSSTV